MATIKTKFAVGLFVLIGFFIIVISFVWLGTSHYLDKGRLYAAYFDQSVQGLAKDSGVKYRGVGIGRVHQLGVAPDGELIEVVVNIDTDTKLEDDMVAELKSVGITGIMFIELDRKKPDDPNLSPKLSFTPDHPVIATKPSSIKRAMDNIETLLDQLGDLDLKAVIHRLKKGIKKIYTAVDKVDIDYLSQKLTRTLEAISNAADNVDLADISREARQTMATLDQTLKDAKVKQISADLRASLQKIDRITGNPKWEAILTSAASVGDSVEKLSNNADRFFQNGSKVMGDGGVQLADLQQVMLNTLEQLNNVSHNLNSMIEVLADHPSRLMFGNPPPPRQVEAE
jgi:phospholipid/cholesterol/gamma-HCH transport system substrate-binding protein